MSTGTLFEMDAQQTIGFPQPLCEIYRPKLISEFIGNEKNKRILMNFCKSPKPCAMLFNGPSGCGKTAMAEAVARELRATTWRIPSQECNVSKIQEITAHCQYVPQSGLHGFHLIICDECSEMTSAARLAWLSKLDGSDPIPQTIIIFTANDAYERLPETFLSRCSLKLEFGSYGASEEIVSLLSRIWQERAGGASAPNFRKLAVGNIRESLARLEQELLAV